VDEFETLVDPGLRIAPGASAITGLRNEHLRGAPRPAEAVRRFLDFAGDAVLVAHNARFDLAFLDRETERLTGSRIAAPVVDTVLLARTLLAGRVKSFSLGQLAWFLGTDARPVSSRTARRAGDGGASARADRARAGARCARRSRTSAPSPRRGAVGCSTSAISPSARRPARASTSFRGRGDQVLYVGRARDLRARLRSYFRSDRQRPAVEAALGAAERIEWRVLGSELEAALAELRLIRELRPPGNARVSRPERHVWLRARGNAVVASQKPPCDNLSQGPLRSRRRAQLAARALRPEDLERPAERVAASCAADSKRSPMRTASRMPRGLRDRIAALQAVCRRARAPRAATQARVLRPCSSLENPVT
jgi:DNA polymerase-3 subunit epsilon